MSSFIVAGVGPDNVNASGDLRVVGNVLVSVGNIEAAVIGNSNTILKGDGSRITNINLSAVTNITADLTGNVTASGNVLVTGNVSAANVVASSAPGKGFFGNGRSVTNIDATNLDTGTLPNARLNTTIAGLSSLTSTALVGDLTGNVTSSGNVSVTGNVSAANVVASSAPGKGLFGNGRSVTNMSAANLDAGTLDSARLPSSAFTGSGATVTTFTATGLVTGGTLKGDLTGNVAASGNVSVTGNVSAANVVASSGAGQGFFGNGRSITNMSATNLDAGSLDSARLPSSAFTGSGATVTTFTATGLVTGGTLKGDLTGNVTSSGNVLVTGNVSAANVTASSAAGLGFFGNGRNITNMSATNVDTGTLNNARLPTNVDVSGTLNANGTTSVVDVTLGGNITLAGQPTFGASTGDGATYTVFNNFIGSWNGLAVRCAFDSTVRHVFNTRNGNLDMTGTCTAAAFSGAGSALTTLSATNVSSGTLNNARLPTNVDVSGTLNANGTVTFSGNVSMNNGKLLTLSNTGVGTQYVDTFANNTLRLFSYGPSNGGQILFCANIAEVGRFNADGLTVTGNASVSKSLTATSNVNAAQLSVSGTGYVNNLVGSNVALTGCVSAYALTASPGQPVLIAPNQSEKMRIDVNGNVGIGNSAAVHSLSVNGNAYVSGSLTAASAVSATGNVGSRSFLRGNGGAVLGDFQPYPVGGNWLALNVGSAILQGGKQAAGAAAAGPVLAFNTYWDGSNWVRSENTTTTIMDFNGLYRWYCDAIGSANVTYTPTLRMTLGATGDLGVTGAVSAASFSGSGASLTALAANQVSTGQLNNARLPTNHDIAGTLNANLAATFKANVNLQTPAFAGGGNPSFIDTGFGQSKETNAGVIGYRRFTSDALDIIGATPDGVVTSGDRRIWMSDKVAMGGSNALGADDTVKIHGNLTVANTATATTFSGSGASLTSLAANQVSTGQLNNARLPSAISVATSLQANSTITLSGTSTSNLYNDAGVLFTRYAAGQSSSTDYFISRGGTTPYALGNVLLIHTPSAVTDAAVIIGTSGGVVRVKVDSVTGYVGIGNSAPAHNLAVNGTVYASGNVQTSANVHIGTVVAGAYLPSTPLTVGINSTDNQLVGNTFGSVATFMRTDGNKGNVGISFVCRNQGSYSIQLAMSAAGTGRNLVFVDNRYPEFPGAGGSTGTEMMRIDNSGNVGIANSAPVHTLAVNGTAYVSGAATFSNDVILNNAGTGYITRNATVVGSGNMHITFVRTGGGSLHSVNFTSNVVTCSGELYSTGNVRIGSATAAPYQLDLTADTARKLTTSTWATGSDARVKSNVEYANLDVCYDVVKAVPLRRFEWDAAQYPDVQDRTVVGWIAQEVEAVFPKAVSSSSERGFDDFRTLSVDQLYKTMYGALQKVMADKEALQDRVAALEVRVTALEQ